MAITLNHAIIHTIDPAATAASYVETLGLAQTRKLGVFTVVDVGPTSLDFLPGDGAVSPRRFAFLVSEAEFDAIFARIQKNGAPDWTDPARKEQGAVNRWDDGLGVYFKDPNGPFLEILTRPYGSSGLGPKHPNPLLLS